MRQFFPRGNILSFVRGANKPLLSSPMNGFASFRFSNSTLCHKGKRETLIRTDTATELPYKVHAFNYHPFFHQLRFIFSSFLPKTLLAFHKFPLLCIGPIQPYTDQPLPSISDAYLLASWSPCLLIASLWLIILNSSWLKTHCLKL